MSTRLMGLCWPLQMPPSPKSVLISLADQANDEGYCWPSVRTLSLRTCLSERTVQAAIRWLEAAGIVEVQIGAKRSNLYTIRPHCYKPPTECAAPPQQLHPSEDVEPSAAPPQQLHPAVAAPPQQSHQPPAAAAPKPSLNRAEITPNPLQQQGADAGPTVKRARRRSGAVTSLQEWLDECKGKGIDAIPEGDPVFAYCDRVGIPREILALHWAEFKHRRKEGAKGQSDWPATFRNSVRGNWYHLWRLPPGGGPAELTTVGLQARADHRARSLQPNKEDDRK